MEAKRNGNGDPWLEYNQLVWGDLIRGTKDQLQALGLGIDRLFPGEAGGPKRQLNVLDPRGFKAKIERHCSDDVFTASIPFPHFPPRPSCDDNRMAFAQGVTVTAQIWYDEYEGTAEALIAAGLLREDWLPGAPGMNKTYVHIKPDGSMVTKGRQSYLQPEGSKTIAKVGKSRLSVCVQVSSNERERRGDASDRARDAWEARVRKLPRPAPLSTPTHRADPADVRAAQGVWVDPGPEEVQRRQDSELARFEVGDEVRMWLDADDPRNGEVVTIVKGYGLHRASCDEGEYVDSRDGHRLTYQTAYSVRHADGRTFVWPAGNLQTMNYKPGHLRLVRSRPG